MKFSAWAFLLIWLFLAVPAANPAPADDVELLRGTWLTVSLVHNGVMVIGEGAPPLPGPPTKLVYEGNKWMLKSGDKTIASGTIKIDSTKTPKEIDIMDDSGVVNAKTKLGIYEINGDIYKYCVAQSGQPRPTEFLSKAGSGYSLTVSKREKP